MAKKNQAKKVKVQVDKAPAAQAVRQKQQTANVRNGAGSRGSVRVRNREFVVDVGPSSAFIVSGSWVVNPGNPSLFPWLSAIAQCYEKYKFHNLRVLYEPQCPTTTAGTVAISIDTDASDTPPTSKQQMLAWDFAARAAPWDKATLSCGGRLTKYDLYVLYGSVPPTSTDVKTYAAGQLYLAVQGTGAFTSPVGELYVEYDVELMQPNMQLPANVSGTIRGSTGVSGTNFFGTAPITLANCAMKAISSGNGFTLDTAGQFLLCLAGVTSSATTPPVNVSVLNPDGSTTNFVSNNSAVATASFVAEYVLKTFGPSTITWNNIANVTASNARLSSYLTPFG